MGDELILVLVAFLGVTVWSAIREVAMYRRLYKLELARTRELSAQLMALRTVQTPMGPITVEEADTWGTYVMDEDLGDVSDQSED